MCQGINSFINSFIISKERICKGDFSFIKAKITFVNSFFAN